MARFELAIPSTEATSILALDGFGKTTTFTTGEPVSAEVAAAQAAHNQKLRALQNRAVRAASHTKK